MLKEFRKAAEAGNQEHHLHDCAAMSEELGKGGAFLAQWTTPKSTARRLRGPTRPPTSILAEHASADLSTAHSCIHVLPDIETRFEALLKFSLSLRSLHDPQAHRSS
jgi:hypothetical protein